MAVKRQHTNKLWLGWNARLCIAAFLLGAMQLTAQPVSPTSYFRTEAGVPCIPSLAKKPVSVTPGAMYLYNNENNLYWYTGNAWMTLGHIAKLNTTFFNPVSGTSELFYGGTLSVTYSGGVDRIPYPAGTPISSTGVTGLTATLRAGTLSSSGTLVFDVTGKPSSMGNAIFTVSFDGKSITASLPIAQRIAFEGTAVVRIVSPFTSKIWMDRNMGATQQATSTTDYLAYGNLYQWCRRTDGHEKITWTNPTTGTTVNGTTTTLSTSTNTPDSKFITTATAPYDWLVTPEATGNAWWTGTLAGANSPCPTGYHAPTYAEWKAELAAMPDASNAYKALKLTMSGYNNQANGLVTGAGTIGKYWTSTVVGPYGYNLEFNSSSSTMAGNGRANGFSVRCIQNEDPNTVPVVRNVVVGGSWIIGVTLSAYYTYSDIDGDTEGPALIQWYRATATNGTGAVAISGATAKTYTVTRDDAGYYIGFEVTPVAATGASPGATVKSPVFRLINSLPVASNVTQTYTNLNVGGVLTGSYTYSDVDGDGESGTAFKWYRATAADGTGAVAISGATAKTYTLTNADQGYYIGFEVTPASNRGSSPGDPKKVTTFNKVNSRPVASSVTQPYTNLNIGGVFTGNYTYSDADNDTQSGTTFQWYRATAANGTGATAISGATGNTYTATSADQGYYIGLGVTPRAAQGSNPGIEVKVTTFNKVNSMPVASNLGQTYANLNVGTTITGSYTYSDADGDTQSGTTFQWYRATSAAGANATAISGATGTTYRLTSADQGYYIVFGVTPRASQGSTPGIEQRVTTSGKVNSFPSSVSVSYSKAATCVGTGSRAYRAEAYVTFVDAENDSYTLNATYYVRSSPSTIYQADAQGDTLCFYANSTLTVIINWTITVTSGSGTGTVYSGTQNVALY